jgi:hypothetical protein
VDNKDLTLSCPKNVNLTQLEKGPPKYLATKLFSGKVTKMIAITIGFF